MADPCGRCRHRTVMHWDLANHFHPIACALADRHYSRKKVGSPQMMPPGRKIVLVSATKNAVWGVNWPYPHLVMHAWPNSMMCTIFRNESDVLSSDLIREAMTCTHWKFPNPPDDGIITFVNPKKVRRKRDPGRCFKKAGWTHIGFTKGGHWVWQLKPEDWPEARKPNFAPFL